MSPHPLLLLPLFGRGRAACPSHGVCSFLRIPPNLLLVLPQEAEARVAALKKKMGLPGYAEKTPAAVQAEDGDKVAKAEAEAANVVAAINDMKALLAAQ